MTLSATLYTKPGCHLCEDAAAALERLRPRHPHELRLVDITVDATLMQEYGLRIPVLAIGGREYDAPLPQAVLEHALQHVETDR
jgi:glutaredoxin